MHIGNNNCIKGNNINYHNNPKYIESILPKCHSYPIPIILMKKQYTT